MDTERLTGKYRFRNGLFGRQILQVEVCGKTYDDNGAGFRSTFYKWRDAKCYETPKINKKDQT